MAEIKNCKICGKIFQFGGFNAVCPNCKDEDERIFEKIRDYLYEHQGASIYEVAQDVGVTISRIKRYLREHRLEIIEKENNFLKCERCGMPIQSGRYCDACVGKVVNGFEAAFKGSGASLSKTKFHYLFNR